MLTVYNIIKYIREALLKNEALSTSVSSQVFPIVAPEETKFPFITLTKSNVNYLYNKDYLTSQTVTVTINIFTANYQSLIEVEELVDNAIEQHFTNSKDRPKMVNNTEDWSEDTYYATIEYEFTL